MKLPRSYFAFLIALTAAGGTFLSDIIKLYAPPEIASSLSAFTTALIAAAIVLLGTEKEKASE